MSDPATAGTPDRTLLVERACAAYLALADLGQTIEDEWQYVADLVEAYLPAIRALGSGREPLAAPADAAVEEAILEIGLIGDPHKAIDWLSTFPHLLALALGSDVDRPGTGPASVGASASPAARYAGESAPGGESADGEAGPDEDSPFRILLRGNS